jgi:hypothetical protein
MVMSENAAKQYLAALEAQKSAEKAVATAKDLLCQALEAEGQQKVEIDGQSVMAVEKVRRTFDAEALRGLVDDATFVMVTKASVDSKKWDKARKTRVVSDAVEEAIITETPYVAIVVKDIDVIATTASEVA